MKRKVLVLTMGVICATQLWHSNHANALVTEGGANDTKQFTEIVSEEKVIKMLFRKSMKALFTIPKMI